MLPPPPVINLKIYIKKEKKITTKNLPMPYSQKTKMLKIGKTKYTKYNWYKLFSTRADNRV